MKRDPVAILRQVRQAAVITAARALAAAVADEARSEAALDDRVGHFKTEQQTLLPGETIAFSLWLPRAQAQLAAARKTLGDAKRNVERCRLELASSRADAEAVLSLLEKRAAEAQSVRGRLDQAVLDEAGSQLLRRRAVASA